jgi:hypothetical protein
MKNRFTPEYHAAQFPPCISGALDRGPGGTGDALRERIRFLGSAGQVPYAMRMEAILMAAEGLSEADRRLLAAFLIGEG